MRSSYGRRDWSTWKAAFGVIALITLLIFSLVRGALVDESTAVKALETQGFSDITITEHAWFMLGFRGGSKEDAARFTATAKNPAGHTVEVHVFVGWPFKGATIRTS